ncbi:transposase [Legionella sp. PATHC038]|uniref:transposase n=1 Tax=Legionella sheltonii TaxID=2992041 RepID=UPI0022433E89|nr:transposase [Legionella sp. PATHC038]MCW8398353.1 transposase [Legionella sp. PATHC038]
MNTTREAYDSLKAQIMELRRHRFGKRSERYIDPENPQLSLFENNQSIFSG